MPLYPDLETENDFSDVVLVLPANHVRLTMIEHLTNQIVGVVSADLKCRHDFTTDLTRVEIDRFSVALNSTIYVLHDELEKFVIGGSVNENEDVAIGPVPGTQYRFVLELTNHVPDSYITDFTCILMNTVNYRASFQPAEETSFSDMDTGDKIGYIIGRGASGISSGVRWTGEQARLNLSHKYHQLKLYRCTCYST